MEPLDVLEAERIAREVELLDERRALAQDEEGRLRRQTDLWRSAAEGRRGRLDAAGFPAPALEERRPAEWFELLDRLGPVLDALGPPSGQLGKILSVLRQWRGVQETMKGQEGRKAPGPSVADLASLLQGGSGEGGDPMALAQGQKLDRQAAAFLRSLGVEAREGEEMTDALRRIATGLSSGQKSEVKEKASKLLEGLMGPSVTRSPKEDG